MNQMSKLDAFIQQAVTAMPISGIVINCLAAGDSALLQRGGKWLAVTSRRCFGRISFGERRHATALFRLNKEEWLDVVRIGRRSFYRLSDKGLRLTRRAEHKFIAPVPLNGRYGLLLLSGLEKKCARRR